MAQISQKPLLDQNSQNFLEEKGLKNISNSFPDSAWRFNELNIILSLPLDTIVKNDKDFYKLIYELGYQNGFDYANSINNFEIVIK